MRYEFLDLQTGDRVELDFPMSQAPPLDTILEHEGRTLQRVVTNPAAIGVHRSGGHFFKPHVSDQIERWHPDAPAHTSDGRAIIGSREQLETTIGRINDRNDKDGIADRMVIGD